MRFDPKAGRGFWQTLAGMFGYRTNLQQDGYWILGGKMKHTKQGVVVNPENWSEASKHSTIYDFPPAEYHDIEYTCFQCEKPSIFTAHAQRKAFEVRKSYIWQRRLLCLNCLQMRSQLERQVKAYDMRWKSERAALAHNVTELTQWLAALKRLPYYGVRRNSARIAMLERLLTEYD